MQYDTKVCVFLHSDGATVDCDCGEREWVVQLPSGWMWVRHEGPGPFLNIEEAEDYASRLSPTHPDVTRCDSSVPDLWILQ